jgi:3',5'-cyclic-AMP phosphodiesterase
MKGRIMSEGITRRGAIKAAAGIATGAVVLPGQGAAEVLGQTDTVKNRRRVLRFAHMTDVHVKPERGAAEGMTKALRHAQSLSDPPELIVNGGDAIMDALGQTRSRTQEQWGLWHSILKNECSLPVESCIGNHDIWGWYKKKSGTAGDEPQWGKASALAELGLNKPYRAFGRAGWRFIVLDSVQLREGGGAYTAKLDDEQFDWLAGELASIDPATPVVIISHIPIVSVVPAFFKDYFKDGKTQVPGALLHTDMHRIKDLFYKHKNIKLCLSGHIHLVDRVEYLGVTYICGGAVSGAWWGGDWHECEAGYGVIDLYDDGGFGYQYVPYGWESRA